MPEPGIGTITSQSVSRPLPSAGQKLDKIIEKWRSQRLALQLCMHQSLLGQTDSHFGTESAQALQQLCTELIDYVSTGHFSVYGQALGLAVSKPSELSSLLHDIYQHIGSTTDLVLQFNDRLEAVAGSMSPESLYRDLLKLHKSLSVRFALEEQLLELGCFDREIQGN